LRNSNMSQMNLMLSTLAGTLVITPIAAHFSYQWVELPFIELGRRFPARKVVIEAEALAQ